MSHFATELEALMGERKITSASELSKMSGVDQATLSRVRSGVQEISHQDLDRISVGFGANAGVHARLLAARLRDELRPPGGPLIEIGVRNGQSHLKESAPNYGAKLPPKIQKTFDVLARNIEDTELRSILTSLANLCEKGSLS